MKRKKKKMMMMTTTMTVSDDNNDIFRKKKKLFRVNGFQEKRPQEVDGEGVLYFFVLFRKFAPMANI